MGKIGPDCDPASNQNHVKSTCSGDPENQKLK